MLPQLQAEQQLAAIEAALVPHMTPDAAKSVSERHRKALKPPEKRKPRGMAAEMLEAFQGAGFAVVHTPAPKKTPSRKRRTEKR